MSERKSLTYVELDIPVCSRTYGVAPCRARLSSENDPVAAAFDAAYLKRGAGLTSAVDSKLWTFSFWMRKNSDAAGGSAVIAAATALMADV